MLNVGNELNSLFKNSPEDGQVLQFDGATQRPETIPMNISSSEKTATVESEVAYGGVNWDDMGDEIGCNITGLGSPYDYVASEYAKYTGFNFAIPTGSVIKGIMVKITKYQHNTDPEMENLTDASVKMVKNGVISGTDKKKTSFWPTTSTEINYGSATDKWGEAWTAEDINAASFGFVVAAEHKADYPGGANAYISNAKIEVFYVSASMEGVSHTELSDIGTKTHAEIDTAITASAHIEDVNAVYVAGELDTEAEIITAINATNAKINEILAMLEAHGLVASS